MHVTRTGPAPEDGAVIVFLHGAMVAGWMWTQQAADLSDYRCVVPDLPGFGASVTEEWLSLSATADQVAALIRDEYHGGSAHVVGLSLGGLVGLHTVAKHPDAVRSLLASGVPSGSLSPPLLIANRLLLWLYCRPWGAAVVARVLWPQVRAGCSAAGRTSPWHRRVAPACG